MPWYINPVITRKVLHRIANRHARASLQELNSTLDKATQLLWNKQHHYHSIKPTGAINSFVEFE
jgi:hypothetical protein